MMIFPLWICPSCGIFCWYTSWTKKELPRCWRCGGRLHNEKIWQVEDEKKGRVSGLT